MILGIDPGAKTATAVFQDGKLKSLHTTDLLGALSFIKIERPALVVIEDSTLQSHIFTAPGIRHAAAMKVARNIGEVDMACKLIKQVCADCGIGYSSVSPKDKGKKMDRAAFAQLTGWQEACNQHERDAGVVAWRFRNVKSL